MNVTLQCRVVIHNVTHLMTVTKHSIKIEENFLFQDIWMQQILIKFLYIIS